MLNCWQANIDVQFVLDAYSCASYIVSYISKGQRGMSNLMQRATQESKEYKLSLKQQMRHFGNQFLTHVEVSAQEAVYFVLQLPLRRSSRGFLFLNTNPATERLSLLKSNAVLEEMPTKSTNVEADNVIKRYSRRPMILKTLCLADFASWYEVHYPAKLKISQSNDKLSQNDLPETEDNDCLDDDDPKEYTMPNDEAIDTLYAEHNNNIEMGDGGVLKKRSNQKILRYVRFNEDLDAENYYRELIMLFHPWRNETKDIPSCLQLLKELYDQFQIQIEQKRKLYESNRKLVEAVENLNGETIDAFDESMNTGFRPENLHSEERDRAIGPTLVEKYGCFDPGKPENYDVGLDVGISRR